MAKLNLSEKRILEEISEWKAGEPGYLNKISHLVSRPFIWAGEKIIPEDAKGSLGKVTESIVDKLHDMSAWTVNEDEVLKATQEFEIESDTILSLKKASVHDLDHVATNFIEHNTRLGAAEGFGTGLIGWPGLLADLPALFTLCFRTIYQVSLSYGFQPEIDDRSGDRDFEVGYMLRIFRVAIAKNSVEKTRALLDLKDFESELDGEVYSELGHDFTLKHIGKNAAINISKLIVNQIVKATFARKAVTSIPGVGAVLTAGFNYYYIQDVGRAAFNIYRERFLLDKKGRKKIINIEID